MLCVGERRVAGLAVGGGCREFGRDRKQSLDERKNVEILSSTQLNT